ncbi:hypothetical protein KA005_17670, partial [bacterium]|nr:hypothetical protein [bacterium]
MCKIIDKIAFIVREPLLYDHWVGIWRLLDNTKFEIVILDIFRNSPNEHFRKSAEEFLDRISKANYSYRFLRDVLSEKIKYRYVISNHLVQGSTLYNQITFKSKFKNYLKIIFNFMFRVFKVNKSFPLHVADQYLPMQIGIKRIRFMYGADISEGWSLSKWNEMFDVFLCHGPNDAGAVSSRNWGEEIIQIGYPRYDDYFNIPNLGEDLNRSFSLSPSKKTILWLPTLGEGVCSIPYYVKQISELSQYYNVIVRPHPMTFRLAPENIKLLFDHH